LDLNTEGLVACRKAGWNAEECGMPDFGPSKSHRCVAKSSCGLRTCAVEPVSFSCGNAHGDQNFMLEHGSARPRSHKDFRGRIYSSTNAMQGYLLFPPPFFSVINFRLRKINLNHS
jgi:hypothetical protein